MKYIEINKPSDVSSSKVKKEVEALAKNGVRSKDILLKMKFVTANPKQITDKFQVLKNQVYFSLPKKIGENIMKKSELVEMIQEVLQEEEFADVAETLEPVSPVKGNPLKSVKAKKAARILAKEEAYIRQMVQEELKFVMFNEVPGTTSRKVAKKRIAQSGGKTL